MRHLTALPDLPDLSDVTVTLVPQGADGTDGTVPLVGYLVLAPAGTQLTQLTELLAAAPAPASASAPAPRPAPAEAGITVDPEERTAAVDGRPLRLTYLEFELLAHLVGHPHRVYTREQLVATIWGYGPVGDQRTVDVHVARLRRKLGAAHRERIVTVRRVGYKYVPAA
ncbi:winged helix-turn-helix domain-containing protein [Streptomyces sp. MP131-18]|uniref:winged helix-turn-helix domain-containing protein n=1 Tax=Streptomyces sp. MP131-18 TaxID=1857892 RepID=UPI00097BFA15|nr:winged helix-turn-helix domain-containing protein [Streptomyces sp. MP131-18]ONK10637.1 Alkaline phosphatase synthesis transcriptional regulatory protein SphR [Streptomyces sp. MP131-18]